MDINSIQVYKIERTFKDGNKIQFDFKNPNKMVASSTKLMNIIWDTWIFSPWAFKHVTQNVESKQKYSTLEMLKYNEVTFHFKCMHCVVNVLNQILMAIT
jgi:hypothetical protein